MANRLLGAIQMILSLKHMDYRVIFKEEKN